MLITAGLTNFFSAENFNNYGVTSNTVPKPS